LFLRALPLVAARRAVRLTVIGAPGGDRCQQEITRIIDSTPGLAEFVEMRGPVPRTDLRAEFGRHDLLLFHSVFREPVAQILLMAAAARLPVVAPSSPDCDSVVREGETAWCYADTSPATIAAAVLRALDNPETRVSRALTFEGEVRQDHSLTHTIEAYDRLLRARVASVRHPERLSA
jgi:glycosyltransferase involved in cell wall biosynthesis